VSRSTGVLLGVFLIVLAGFWFLQQGPGRQPPKASGPALIFPFKVRDVQRMTITRGSETVEIVRQGTEWALRRPQALPADRFKVESLVTTLAGLAPTRNLGNRVQNLDPYGLINPQLQVEIEAPTGRTYRLLVGAQTPEKTGYYVKAEPSGTVYVIGDDLVKTQLIANLESPPRATPSP
jgi:hypothetical protein